MVCRDRAGRRRGASHDRSTRSFCLPCCIALHWKSSGQITWSDLPVPDGKTIFEVRLIGEERIYRVLGERVEQWANEQARKQQDDVYERVNRRRSRSQRG
jgi:hypothetical protein